MATAKGKKSTGGGKKKVVRKGGGSGEGDGGPVSYSTRFEGRQRGWIDEAAELQNVSPAKFIREASVRRAMDVLNAASGAVSLRKLVDECVDQLVNPRVEFTKKGSGGRSGQTCVVSYEEWQHRDDGEPVPEDWDDSLIIEERSVKPLPLHYGRREKIETVLETSGTRFLEMFRERLEAMRAEPDEYVPRILPDELFSSVDDE